MAETPHDALADGRVSDAIALQRAALDADPESPAAGLFLMELLAVGRRFREARGALDGVATADPDWPAARRRFRRLLRLLGRRDRGGPPRFLADPPRHALRRWLAARALRRGDHLAAQLRIDRADGGSPHVLGHVDGREFDGLRDADDRFASVLEAFVGREYVWIPFEHLRRVTLPAAQHVLDRVVRPARLRLADSSELAAHLPLTYPGPIDGDEGLLAGLDTDRRSADGGVTTCVGAKLLLTRDEEIPLGEVRQFDFRASF